MKTRRRLLAVLLTVVLSLTLASAASAHVVVYPKQTTQGSYEKFTVRVPTEKDSPTMKVEVKIPDSVTISRFEPKPDWSYTFERDDSGKIVSVTWTAEGAGLSATEFGEFNMQGRVADDASELVWRAYQTYGDGEVVEWVGAADSDKPASVTTVLAPAAAASGQVASADDAGESSALDRYLAIAALVISVLALVIALIRKQQKA